MDYIPSYTNRWKNRKIRKLSPWARHLFEYLAANGQTTSSGIYPLDVAAASVDLGLSSEIILVLLEELAVVPHRARPKPPRRPLIKFDGQVIWIVGQWKHAINQSGNHMNRVGYEFNRAPRFPWWKEFFELYPGVLEHCRTHKRFNGREAFARLYDQVQKIEPELFQGHLGKPFRAFPLKPSEALRDMVLEALPARVRKPFLESLGSPSREALRSPSSEALPQTKKHKNLGGVGPRPTPPLPGVTNRPAFDPTKITTLGVEGDPNRWQIAPAAWKKKPAEFGAPKPGAWAKDPDSDILDRPGPPAPRPEKPAPAEPDLDQKPTPEEVERRNKLKRQAELLKPDPEGAEAYLIREPLDEITGPITRKDIQDGFASMPEKSPEPVLVQTSAPITEGLDPAGEEVDRPPTLSKKERLRSELYSWVEEFDPSVQTWADLIPPRDSKEKGIQARLLAAKIDGIITQHELVGLMDLVTEYIRILKPSEVDDEDDQRQQALQLPNGGRPDHAPTSKP